MHVACVNQDAGIAPDRAKGAAVHLQAMRDAFRQVGAVVHAIDSSDDSDVTQRLKTLRDRNCLDVIYERYALGRAATARFAKRNGVPLVIEANAPLAAEGARWRGRTATDNDRINDACAFGAAAQVIAVSAAVAEYAVERGADPGSVAVFSNGVDPVVFNTERRRDSVRGNVVPGDAFIVGFHGRPRPWHGLANLVEACATLLDRGYPLHLLTVGDGDFACVEQLPSAHRTVVGWQPHAEMARYVAAFDVLPLTYGADIPLYFSPLKLMEAMACGVVPVVPDSGDLPDIVSNRVTGIVYPHGDFQQLVEELEFLITQPRKRRAMGKSASAVADEFSWTRIAEFVLRRTADSQSDCSTAAPRVAVRASSS